MDLSRYLVEPGSHVGLDRWDTRDDGGFDRDEGEARIAALNTRLEELQEALYAEGRHAVLVVLQATDTGGKDGTIRHVFDRTNPQGVDVAGFKRPTEEEQAHDFLWRVHRQMPRRGQITIFNRSHYEDVLVVRVHGLVPEPVWTRRYQHINDFERMLVDEGTTILKLFLHISKEEQRERLQARIADPTKHWKFEKGDLDERKRWDDYQEAFRAMLELTSTEHAPWHVIPADRKWFRNLVVSELVVATLERLDPRFPPGEADLDSLVVV